MRVAIVTESFLPSTNGVTQSVVQVVKTLKQRGDDVLLIAPTSPGPKWEGYPVMTVPFVPLGGFPVAIPTPSIATALDAFQPELVHAAAPFWLGGQAIGYAAKRRIASVAVYQTNVAGYMERYGLEFAGPLLDTLTQAIHRPATLSLAPTADGMAYLQGLGISRVDLWGRGVDSALFHPQRRDTPSARSFRGSVADEGERLVGYVGRLAPEKQVARLREICELPNTRLVIVGEGPDREELQKSFHRLPVTFTGKLVDDDLADAYASLDVFVHCGTEETFGQTIQEALASGVPVVAPQVGGQRHLVRDGLDGYLVDPKKWGAYRDAVEAILSHDERRRAMSFNARLAVAGKTWEANNEVLLRHYEWALSTVSDSVSLAA
jgi:phosphatidylinositol alpha 1,6-mannosyltransferase